MQALLYRPINGGEVRPAYLPAWYYGCCEIVEPFSNVTPYTLKFLHTPCRTSYTGLYLAVGFRLAYLPESSYGCCEMVETTSNITPTP